MYKLKLFVVLLVFLNIILLFYNSKDYSSVPEVLGTTFSLTSESAISSNNKVFHLKNSNCFKGDIEITNLHPTIEKYYLLVMINYKQQEYVLGGNRKFVHCIEISPYDSVSFEIIIDRIPPGYNDLLAILVREPADHFTNLNYSPHFTQFSSRRSIIVVNNQNILDYDEFSIATASNGIKSNSDSALLLSKFDIIGEEGINVWTHEQYENKNSIQLQRFWAHFFYEGQSDYVLVGFLNYRQVKLLYEEEKVLCFYGTLENSVVSHYIEMDTVLESESYPQDFFLISITNPYSKNELHLNPNNIFPSNRVRFIDLNNTTSERSY